MTKADESAFPYSDGFLVNEGMTKREHFAALAMQGLLSDKGSYFPDTQHTGELCATAAVKYADALIKALNEKTGES